MFTVQQLRNKGYLPLGNTYKRPTIWTKVLAWWKTSRHERAATREFERNQAQTRLAQLYMDILWRRRYKYMSLMTKAAMQSHLGAKL